MTNDFLSINVSGNSVELLVNGDGIQVLSNTDYSPSVGGGGAAPNLEPCLGGQRSYFVPEAGYWYCSTCLYRKGRTKEERGLCKCATDDAIYWCEFSGHWVTAAEIEHHSDTQICGSCRPMFENADLTYWQKRPQPKAAGTHRRDCLWCGEETYAGRRFCDFVCQERHYADI